MGIHRMHTSSIAQPKNVCHIACKAYVFCHSFYQRKLRNRYSAARSRRRRSIILNEINEQVFSLKSFIKTLQCRLLVCEREDFLSTLNERFEEIRTNLFAQWERLLSVEYQIAILRAKLMGTKVKGITSMENKAALLHNLSDAWQTKTNLEQPKKLEELVDCSNN